MTAQISDKVRHRGEVFELSSRTGSSGLFDPGRFGLSPMGTCSACWRGHICHYEIQEGRLYLARLDTNHYNEGDNRPPEINGVHPVTGKNETMTFQYCYDGLMLPVGFCGSIIIAKDFIQELYVHMGMHPHWKYEVVRELKFDRGKLVGETDISDKGKRMREMVQNAPPEPPAPDNIDV